MKRAWPLAWRSLGRQRRRNAATIAAIAFGYAGLVLLGGYAVRIERFLRTNAVYLQHAGHVAVWAHEGLDRAESDPLRFQLSPDAQAKILALAQSDSRVEFAGRYVRGMALAGNGCTTRPTMMVGAEPAVLGRLVTHPEVREWSPELAATASGRWPVDPAEDGGAALAAGLAGILHKSRTADETRGQPPAPALLDCDGPDALRQLSADADVQLVGNTYDGLLNAVDVTMTGTFHAASELEEDGAMLTSVGVLQRLFATDRVAYVALFLHRAEDAPAVAADLRKSLESSGFAVDVLTYQDERWVPYYVGTMQMLGSLVVFITLLVATVLVLTVAGAMTLALLERTRELGTWRALGFSRGQVLGLLVRESLLVGVAGSVLGIALGLAAAAAVNASGLRFQPPGVPGDIALLVRPALWTCVVPGLVLLPGIAAATWLVARRQLARRPAELLISQTA
jgi:putative ABC transport system permease protein